MKKIVHLNLIIIIIIIIIIKNFDEYFISSFYQKEVFIFVISEYAM